MQIDYAVFTRFPGQQKGYDIVAYSTGVENDTRFFLSGLYNTFIGPDPLTENIVNSMRSNESPVLYFIPATCRSKRALGFITQPGFGKNFYEIVTFLYKPDELVSENPFDLIRRLRNEKVFERIQLDSGNFGCNPISISLEDIPNRQHELNGISAIGKDQIKRCLTQIISEKETGLLLIGEMQKSNAWMESIWNLLTPSFRKTLSFTTLCLEPELLTKRRKLFRFGFVPRDVLDEFPGLRAKIQEKSKAGDIRVIDSSSDWTELPILEYAKIASHAIDSDEQREYFFQLHKAIVDFEADGDAKKIEMVTAYFAESRKQDQDNIANLLKLLEGISTNKADNFAVDLVRRRLNEQLSRKNFAAVLTFLESIKQTKYSDIAYSYVKDKLPPSKQDFSNASDSQVELVCKVLKWVGSRNPIEFLEGVKQILRFAINDYAMKIPDVLDLVEDSVRIAIKSKNLEHVSIVLHFAIVYNFKELSEKIKSMLDKEGTGAKNEVLTLLLKQNLASCPEYLEKAPHLFNELLELLAHMLIEGELKNDFKTRARLFVYSLSLHRDKTNLSIKLLNSESEVSNKIIMIKEYLDSSQGSRADKEERIHKFFEEWSRENTGGGYLDKLQVVSEAIGISLSNDEWMWRKLKPILDSTEGVEKRVSILERFRRLFTNESYMRYLVEVYKSAEKEQRNYRVKLQSELSEERNNSGLIREKLRRAEKLRRVMIITLIVTNIIAVGAGMYIAYRAFAIPEKEQRLDGLRSLAQTQFEKSNFSLAKELAEAVIKELPGDETANKIINDADAKIAEIASWVDRAKQILIKPDLLDSEKDQEELQEISDRIRRVDVGNQNAKNISDCLKGMDSVTKALKEFKEETFATSVNHFQQGMKNISDEICKENTKRVFVRELVKLIEDGLKAGNSEKALRFSVEALEFRLNEGSIKDCISKVAAESIKRVDGMLLNEESKSIMEGVEKLMGYVEDPKTLKEDVDCYKGLRQARSMIDSRELDSVKESVNILKKYRQNKKWTRSIEEIERRLRQSLMEKSQELSNKWQIEEAYKWVAISSELGFQNFESVTSKLELQKDYLTKIEEARILIDKDIDSATKIISELKQMEGNNDRKNLIDEIVKKSLDALAQFEKKELSLQNAIKAINRIKTLDRENPNVNKYQLLYETRKAEILEEARKKLKEKKWTDASKLAKEVVDAEPSNEEAKKIIDEAKKGGN